MYQLTKGDAVIRLADNAIIHPGSSDYADYVEWAKTNTAQAAYALPPPTPQQIADTTALTLAKANANLVLLIGATRAQIGSFCTVKFPTLTVAERDTLADMLFAIKLVAKDMLR